MTASRSYDFRSPLELLPIEKLKEYGRAGYQKRFRRADPYPHIAIDDFMDPDLLRAILAEFPDLEQENWKKTQNETHEIKTSFSKAEELGPATWLTICALNSSTFLDFLTGLTGIKGLVSDPYLRGGGLHQILPGGKLGVHADFNYYKQFKLYRRLNALVYLNEDWDEAWGGHLQLWDRDMSRCVEKIAPLFNRLVVFETSNFSWHGHPEPLQCPEGRARRSLALYYYSVDYPYEDDLEPHTTIFREVPENAS